MEAAKDSNRFAFPHALMTKLKAVAEAQHRSIGDVVRELVEQGLEQQCQVTVEQERQRPMTEEYRQTIRQQIAQGVASARAGRLVDGEAVFSRIRAEMAEREQLGSQPRGLN